MEICPICKMEFKSVKEYHRHLALWHDAFKTGEFVEEATIKSLDKVMDRTLFLLLKFPETRNPTEEGYLFQKYIQYFIGTFVWDTSQQGFTSRDNKAIPYKLMAITLKQLNSVSRARRKLQEIERKDKEKGLTYLHILPDDTHQELADASEVIHRKYFGGKYG